MEVITFDSEAYKALIRKIERIDACIREQAEKASAAAAPDPAEIWLDDKEAATLLELSQRTLQRLRTRGEVTYSIRGGRVRYTLAEVQRLIKGRIVKSKYRQESDLIAAHREYYRRRQARAQPLRDRTGNNRPNE